MRPGRTSFVALLLLAATIGLPASAAAQRAEVVRIGQDYTLAAGETIREVVVIFGDASIASHVSGDMVVVLGALQLSSTATIDGDLVVVGGSGAVSSGAQVYGDFVLVGGVYDAPAEFMPGGGHVVIGPGSLGGRLAGMFPWVTRGLLWGRPIVPDLGWVWGVIGAIFLISVAMNFVFDRPIRACAETLVDKPLSAFATGLLVLLLAAPVCLLLVVSVVGIAVVPFVICALLLGWIVGKIGVARGIGMTAARQTAPESHVQAFRSFLIGFAVICLAYMVPVFGFVAWALSGVFGLGAAMLAVIAGYRAENPPRIPHVPASPAAGIRYPDANPVLPIPEAAGDRYPLAAAPAVATGDIIAFPRAPFLLRLGAFVLDVILVAIARQLLNLESREGAIFLLLLAYHIGFWTWKGTTVGGVICQLRLIRVDGTPLRFVDALVRGLSSIFSLAVFGLGCLWILKDPERQAWHDKIAGTYVVKVPRGWPL